MVKILSDVFSYFFLLTGFHFHHVVLVFLRGEESSVELENI